MKSLQIVWPLTETEEAVTAADVWYSWFNKAQSQKGK